MRRLFLDHRRTLSTLHVAVLCAACLPPKIAPAAAPLPVGTEPPAIGMPHFPDRIHAFVWRNWQLVEPQRIAAVLETSENNVVELADSMGLPPAHAVPATMLERGYITLVRRNWHLLPYDQLLTLLNITDEELAFRLREDDFLFIKLGNLKPKCERLVYREPNAAVRQRAAEIKQLVQHHFGTELAEPGEPRFQFVEQLRRMESKAASPRHDATASTPGRLRYIYSYFGAFGDPLANPDADPYPDGLLSRLSDVGVNGVWLHVVLRQLAPGDEHFPEFGQGHERRLAQLRQLVERARRFGIAVYLYMNEPRAMPAAFFANRPEMAGVREGDFTTMCTSDARVRQWVGDALEHVFRQVPGLGGVFTITASENLTNCWSHNHQQECPRCRQRTEAEVIAEINTAIEQGVHRGNPAARVIVWDWGWQNHGEAPETIARLPKSVWLMSVSEWSKPIVRGGVASRIGEYSLSEVGPGPRAQRHWELAKAAGLKTAAKLQFNTTWELSAVPYLPVLDLVAEHCQRLAAADVDAMMLSWTVGGYPSSNLRVAHRFSQDPKATAASVLDAVALETAGADAAPQVRRAWTSFSAAFREFPYHVALLYQGPQQMGPANLLFGEPSGYRSTMVCFPYDDLHGWRGPYPPDVLATQFERVARGWQDGLSHWQQAIPLVPPELRASAEADLRIATAAYLHFASVGDQVRFITARDELRSPDVSGQRREELKDQMDSLLTREIDHARQLFTLARQDSRIGFEASNHYFYVPLDLVEKVLNCDWLIRSLTQ